MLTPGTRLGPYDIQSVVGTGGMGEVYRARDTRLERTVAIKLLSTRPDGTPQLRAHFEREARTISQLNHPHICTLYDIGETPGAGPDDPPLSYLVMEFLEGETLAERLARGPLPVDRALVFAMQIADALDKAHRKGIIHGDLKPGNVMVTRGGIKLLDFGLSRQRVDGPRPGWSEASTQTVEIAAPGTITGTLQYLAPEQLEGRESDERSDIYACGAVISEMLTGRRAFEGETPAAVIAAIMQRAPTLPGEVVPGIPPAVDHVVATCLAKDPDDRWQHAGDLARELRWLVASPPKPVDPAAAAGASRTSRLWAGIAAVLLLLCLGLVAALVTRRPSALPVVRTSVLLPDGLRFPNPNVINGVGRFALSPDGLRLAFVATEPNGSQMLWVRALDAVAATAIPGTEGAASPFWSADSRQIGFVAQGQLRVVNPSGGAPTTIAAPAFGTTGAWSRDNVILFTPSVGSPLYSVPATGGTPKAVTTLQPDGAEQLHRNPYFLPDGRHFLYVVSAATDGGGRRGLYVATLDGSTPATLLVENAASAKYADGYLVFLRDKTLLAQRFDPDSLALAGEPRTVADEVELSGPSSAAFSLSDTGLLAYQPASGQGSQLLWLDRAGRQVGTVGEPADFGDIELSPDGRQVAVTIIDPATSTRDIWLVDVARGVRTRFTFDRADDVAPIWSHDGTRIVFTSNRGGHFDLYVKPTSGIGMETRLFEDEGDKYPTSWSWDGKAILFWSFNSDGTSIWHLPLNDAAKPTRFLPSPVNPGRFSPDGRHILYYSAESGRSEIYLVPYPIASRRWQVSDAGGSFSRWRADGREVFWVGRDNRLMAATVDATGTDVQVGAAQPLFDARPVGPRYFYDVAPEGDRFLVNSLRPGAGATSIALVQHWIGVLEP